MTADLYCLNNDVHACVIVWHLVGRIVLWFVVTVVALLAVSMAWNLLEQRGRLKQMHRLSDRLSSIDAWSPLTKGTTVRGAHTFLAR